MHPLTFRPLDISDDSSSSSGSNDLEDSVHPLEPMVALDAPRVLEVFVKLVSIAIFLGPEDGVGSSISFPIPIDANAKAL